nr:hypothetical protein [Tanacetum cinerariifolium]
KIDWLKEGDSNSAYFHKAADGILFENDNVVDVFVSHYETFLGQPGTTSGFNDSDLFRVKLADQEALDMTRNVSRQEVKSALFFMGNDKAPGPDGYTAAFFKETWNIVADDFVAAVCEFFTNGKILKELNHTIIALIPKVNLPSRVNDYRPISCCNVLFKCISKIIANRIKESLRVLISPNQSAFVPGRSIANNILLTQKLMLNYHLDRGLPRCAFKVDIQKAYDTVDWEFSKQVLIGFGFHTRMITWIMKCVTTTSFSISINGSLYGFFKGMLLLLLDHRYCSKLELINLCFADDLFLFAHGDVDSVSVIKNALFVFKEASGLVPGLPKSTAYFCNVPKFTKIAILQTLPFEEERLPVKYLGVPLVSSRLIFRDCKGLLEKVQARIDDWKNKSLSAAGRWQLIRSVIGSMHVYWASVFILPSRVLLDIEQLMRAFLWKGRAKVAWEVLCLPREEGGLGVQRLDLFNKALMVSHIWKLLTLKESLWVKWVHSYKLNGRNFWDIPYRGKIPLSNMVSCREWYRASLSSSSKVKEVFCNGVCLGRGIFLIKYPLLSSINVLNISPNAPDQLGWHNELGLSKPFSVATVWSTIRPRNAKVDWCKVVWFTSCIPRHAFNFWLVIKQRLKTQDKMARWDVSGSLSTVCPLCELVPDSHEHLFFERSFSQQIWNHMKSYAGLSTSSPLLSHIISIVTPIANRKSSRSVIAKLVMAATTYVVWQERNARLFKNSKRSVNQVIEVIFSSIRLKLLSCRFKKSKNGADLDLLTVYSDYSSQRVPIKGNVLDQGKLLHVMIQSILPPKYWCTSQPVYYQSFHPRNWRCLVGSSPDMSKPSQPSFPHLIETAITSLTYNLTFILWLC